ncbi:conserved hypothetical protein [Ricinus communis]|uniref:Uncharacterized protein n=1 Tax=Ricinus communis TaxID=3988 RepID=B9RYB7_RICCO|nr:conserved hypothetical protein [Ricinus communis]
MARSVLWAGGPKGRINERKYTGLVYNKIPWEATTDTLYMVRKKRTIEVFMSPGVSLCPKSVKLGYYLASMSGLSDKDFGYLLAGLGVTQSDPISFYQLNFEKVK